MKLHTLIFAGLLLVPTAWAQNASIEGQLDRLLVSILTAPVEARFEVLNAAITGAPLDTQQLVATGLQAGYSANDVQNQCGAGLGDGQIQAVMQAMIQDDADIEPMMAACLPHVSPTAIAEIMTMLFQEVSPLMLETTAQTALSILTENGVDARAILVSSLAESGALSADGYECGASCLSSFADNLLESVAVDGVTENVGQETAFSGS